MKLVDRELVQRLLENDSLSFREIARQAGCSDWSVRSIARQPNSGSRLTKGSRDEPREAGGEEDGPSGWAAWGPFAVLVAGSIGVLVIALRRPAA